MEYTVNFKLAENQNSNNGFINKTGFYDIEITNAEIREGRTLWINYKRLDGDATGILFIQILYKNGSRSLQADVFDQLLIVNGIKYFKTKPAVTKKTKDGKTQISEEISELKGKQVSIFVVNKYSKWNNQISQSINVHKVFSYPERASVREIINNDSFGKDYEYFKSKAKLETVYNKVTKEEVDAWIKSKIDKNVETPKEIEPNPFLEENLKENNNDNGTLPF